jgi:hypothetical protein
LATIPDSHTGVISGCYVKPGKGGEGRLRVIDAESGKRCKSSELPLNWNQQGPPGSPGAVYAVLVASGGNGVETNSSRYTDFPGASIVVSVPPGQTELLIARFSAETTCYGAPVSEGFYHCLARIVVDGAEMDPESGDFDLDASGLNPVYEADSGREGHSMERSYCCVGEGTHTVKVQWLTYYSEDNNTAGTFAADDWHLTVEQISR